MTEWCQCVIDKIIKITNLIWFYVFWLNYGASTGISIIN